MWIEGFPEHRPTQFLPVTCVNPILDCHCHLKADLILGTSKWNWNWELDYDLAYALARENKMAYKSNLVLQSIHKLTHSLQYLFFCCLVQFFGSAL